MKLLMEHWSELVALLPLIALCILITYMVTAKKYDED